MQSDVLEAPIQESVAKPVASFIKPIDFSITDTNIEKYRADYMSLTINGIDDKDGAEIVHAARMIVKNSRLSVEKIGKELMADAIAYQKQVKEEAARIKGLLVPIEDHLERLETDHKNEIKRVKEAAEAAKRARVENRVERLRSAGMTWDGDSQVYGRVGLNVWITWKDVEKLPDDEFEDQVLIVEEFHADQLAQEVEAQRQAEEQRKAQEEADRKERERVAAEQKAERDRLDAARKEQEAEKQRLAQQAEELRQRMAAFQAEIDRAERERVAAENAEKERQAEADRKEKEQQAERNREMQKAQEARNQKRQTAIDARLQKEREQRLAADKVKVKDYVSTVQNLELPQLENEETQAVLLTFYNALTSSVSNLQDQINAL